MAAPVAAVAFVFKARFWLRLAGSLFVAVAAVGVVVLVAVVGFINGASAESSTGGPLREGAVPPALVSLYESSGGLCEFVSPALLAAVNKVESDFDANAVGPVTASGDRAQGISQFMPRTWAQWGVDANGDGVANVFDPADAIPSQAAYLCHIAVVVGGIPGDRVSLMLSGYNAGEYAVVGRRGIVPATLGYVERVKRFAAEFASPASEFTGPIDTNLAGPALPGYPRLPNGMGPNAERGRLIVAETFGVRVAVSQCYDSDGQGHVSASYHYTGHACDVVVGLNAALGQQISAWAIANHESLGVVEVIHARRIWTVRSGAWRPYSGASPHTTHVHLSFDRSR